MGQEGKVGGRRQTYKVSSSENGKTVGLEAVCPVPIARS
jgi:hypothetical protein